jgi:HipA-like protein
VLPRIDATRYVTPLREGGSLPGLVEASDLGTYVMKLTGAGQGPRVLAAEVIVARIARELGLRVPDLVALRLCPEIAKFEADQEVQELLAASLGLNLGIDFLPGSFGFTASVDVEPSEAAAILWLDGLVANVDRSWRNPNLLLWHKKLWCIDHGASLYFHHGWPNALSSPERFAAQPYDASAHVLRSYADAVPALDAALTQKVSRDVLEEAVADVPDEWLPPVPGAETADQQRALYVDHLLARLRHRDAWLPREAAA